MRCHLTIPSTLLLLASSAFAAQVCRPATADDLNKIPGIQKLKTAVQADFNAAAAGFGGSESDPGAVEATARDDTRNTRGAEICASDGPYDLIIDPETMDCSEQGVTYGAVYDGATGFLMLSITSGFTSTNSLTVTHSSAYGVDFAVGVTINFPISQSFTGVATATVTQRWDWKDETSSTQSQAINQIVAYTSTCNGLSGQACNIDMNVTTCFAEASVIIPVTLSGWFRANFDGDVAYTGQNSDVAKNSWWFNPELTYGLSADDLTSNMIIQGSLSSESRAKGYVRGVDISTENTTPLPNATGFAEKLTARSLGNTHDIRNFQMPAIDLSKYI